MKSISELQKFSSNQWSQVYQISNEIPQKQRVQPNVAVLSLFNRHPSRFDVWSIRADEGLDLVPGCLSCLNHF